MRVPSIRARLALWYAGVFALFLVAFAAAGYSFVARTSLANVDQSLYEAGVAVGTALDLEAEERQPPRSFVPRVVHELRFRDLTIAVFDRQSDTLLTGQPAEDDSTFADEDSSAARTAANTEAAGFRSALDAGDSSAIAALLARTPAEPTFTSLATSTGPVRVLALPRRIAGRQLVIGTMHSLRAQRRLVHQVGLGLAAAIPLMLLLATAGGYLLARQSLRPVALMTERAARIGATTLHERLPVQNPRDELGRLASVFNDLLARLDRAFDQQRQFIADASHELRTPVAILSGEADLALSQRDRSTDELQTALERVREEARRLQQIVEDLFLLARADAGERLVNPQELYLGELAGECVRSVRTLAAKKGIAVAYEGSHDLPLSGDEALLRRVLINLLDNAIKYTPSGGSVAVRGREAEGRYVIEVSDSGPGIPPEARAHLFDRFFRVRGGRSQPNPTTGAGLGLAIARRIVEAHGGTLDLARSDASGTTFAVALPAPALPSTVTAASRRSPVAT